MTTTFFILGIYTICMFILVILWLQSGLDKVFNFKDNLDWMKGHFLKSPLKGMVKFLLVTLTLLEVSAGIAGAGAIIDIWFFKTWYLPFIACTLSIVSLAALFLGQRVAKDYGGAAGLVGYMIYTLLLFFFTTALYLFYSPEFKSFLSNWMD